MTDQDLIRYLKNSNDNYFLKCPANWTWKNFRCSVWNSWCNRMSSKIRIAIQHNNSNRNGRYNAEPKTEKHTWVQHQSSSPVLQHTNQRNNKLQHLQKQQNWQWLVVGTPSPSIPSAQLGLPNLNQYFTETWLSQQQFQKHHCFNNDFYQNLHNKEPL